MEERKILHDLVKEEARKLRENATPEELSKLDFQTLDYDNISMCIYGQMTGNCLSDRANELVIKCCDKIYSTEIGKIKLFCNILSESILEGKPFKIMSGSRLNYYISPIERFICVENNGNISRLVKYLKKETDELNFV